VFLYRLIYNSLPLLLPPHCESVPQTNNAGPARVQGDNIPRNLEKYVGIDALARPWFSLIAGTISGGIAIRAVDAGLRSGIAQQGFVRSVPYTRLRTINRFGLELIPGAFKYPTMWRPKSTGSTSLTAR